MNKEITLSPEQLFYMGRLLQAKYIDYAYVAAMDDINHNFALFESEAKADLVSAGILMEDFGGNVEVDPAVLRVLKPVFFGETEASIDICWIGEQSSVVVYKYHFYDGAVTVVTGSKGKLKIKTTDEIEIRELIESLIPKAYVAENQIVETVDKEKITRFIAFKRSRVGANAVVKTYIDADGLFYRENGAALECVTRDQFVTDAVDVIKEG